AETLSVLELQDGMGNAVLTVATQRLLAAAVNTVDELPALAREPLFLAHFLATHARFVFDEGAEVAVTVEVVLEFAQYKVGNQRIVEVANARNLVGDHVFRHGEI